MVFNMIPCTFNIFIAYFILFYVLEITEIVFLPLHALTTENRVEHQHRIGNELQDIRLSYISIMESTKDQGVSRSYQITPVVIDRCLIERQSLLI